MMEKRTNCWEFKKCGRDKTASCPAYPKGGRVCYLVPGTVCGGHIEKKYALKIENCKECDFYKALVSEKTF